ncbi:glycosyltransferase family 4 protein [Sedimentitalea sp. JM2-8]|uniref:Glycosyltransferase family 4 protein n=1 Tax=Sedimentitalea xiamensis TaxID=3050037 RepID=A0ABT7FIA6_9RHOB|nr:glycosyltransferase family 4 protein [Sedimentitalea xiamensis]MDK3074775.1 glycosyltransferase family 4 protein [Sedimentitalea xiamensis]
MRRIAFYAPMKPPTHPVPSGDRAFGRALMAAMATEDVAVDLVSELQLHDGRGDALRQTELRDLARRETARLIDRLGSDRPMLWVSYHNYYKAPDLIGPAVCARLGLPYVQIESSRAKKRLAGPWAGFAAAAEAATDAADMVFHVTAHDLITLKRDRPPGQTLVSLPPFLPRADLPEAADCGGTGRPILAAGMMRQRDKLDSYAIIAETLAQLTDPGWHLWIAGDGPARAEVETLMAPFAGRVRFLGRLDADGMADAYEQAALFFWPGVNEAFGMTYLEAQAAGLPVVAQDRPGVRDVLAPGAYPAPEDGATALALAIDALLSDPALRRTRGAAARRRIGQDHLLGSARDRFWSAVAPLVGGVR